VTTAPQALALCNRWRDSWFLTDRRTIPEWARENVTLVGDFAQKGPFIASKWMEPIFADLQNPFVRRVRVRKGNRAGGTLVGYIWLLHSIVQEPAPFLWLMHTEDAMLRQMEKYIIPLMEACPPVKALMPTSASQDKVRRLGQTRKNRMNYYFAGGSLTFGGANLSTVQSYGAQRIFCDETWMPPYQELYPQILTRQLDFAYVGETKILDSSQGGVVGDVEDKNFQEGQQAELYFKCPNCGGSTPMAFNPEHWVQGLKREDGRKCGIVWDERARNKDGFFDVELARSTAKYRCLHCGNDHNETPEFRRVMDATQHYIDVNPRAASIYRSYHVEALVRVSFSESTAEFCSSYNAYRQGVRAAHDAFRQKYEALPAIQENDRPVDYLRSQSERYNYRDYMRGIKWENEAGRCLTVDRQKRGFWCEIGAWRANGEYRQLFYGWVERVEEVFLLQKEYLVESRSVFEDCGYEQSSVFSDSIRYGWTPLRGDRRQMWLHKDENTGEEIGYLPWSPLKKIRHSDQELFQINFSSTDAKDILHNRLAGTAQYHGLPMDVSDSWKKQINGEVKGLDGIWKKITDSTPNHANDTGAMQVIYALIQGFIYVEVAGKEK
jgi:DNA-directed RNA polymerase subunit RPC12/RpoP